MRSRAARISSSLLAILALAGIAAYVAQTERRLSERHATLREVDALAYESTQKLTDIRTAQQAYVAIGQSTTFWVPKVAELLPEISAGIDRLRTRASTEPARRALLDASASLTELGNIDKRARDYLAAEQPLMAADVLFSEARETAAEISGLIEAARLTDRQSLDADQGFARRREATAAASAGGLVAVILLWLGLAAPRAATQTDDAALPVGVVEPESSISLRLNPSEPVRTVAAEAASPDEPEALLAAARVCTEFGCVQNAADLKRVLARAAGVLDASGLVVWLGSVKGADLRPVIAHGYSDQILGLMRAVPRHADNAAAAAYRSGALQVVPAKPGTSLGAVVAPIVTAEGCIGALTAEIKDNAEVSATVHAVATIFASQLSGVLSASAQESGGAAAAAS
jgi:hypothetical protein